MSLDSDGVNVPILWDVKTTAQMLGVSQSTVRREIASGALPFVEIRGRKLINPKGVNDYVAKQTRYNLPRVELLPSLTGENTCNSISEKASTTCPTSRQVEDRLDALLKPATRS